MVLFSPLGLQSFEVWPLVCRAGPTATAALSACGCGCGVVCGCLVILAAAGKGSIANSRTGRVGVGGLSVCCWCACDAIPACTRELPGNACEH